MASEIYRRPAGTGLTPEELAALLAAENYPPEYDEDSPKFTPQQLAQFRPANFATMEERAEAVKAAVKLMTELEKGKISGEEGSWHSFEEARKEFAPET